jgi:AraC family transcriptional regulator, regulatory protein of adaptative response / methylated-DNA-[protein]-cysteine methyltransferase
MMLFDSFASPTPGTNRSPADRTSIRYALGTCSLGRLLVAATEAGVCAILFGDDPDALVRDLQNRFPGASLSSDAALDRFVPEVVRFIEAPQLGLDLPLDLRGTEFQKKVWQALSEIPVGSTASYAEVAAKIGAPEAVRAVAQACAANPIAVAIPCHRVVGSDGALSGYRWGVARKQVLLDREASA